MQKINKHIEIVRSSVVCLSSLSQESCDAIFEVLQRSYATVGVTTVNNLADLEALAQRKPDLVFLGMKFVPLEPGTDLLDSQKVWLAGYLEERGITCTGSPRLAHELDVNKDLAKQRVTEADVRTAPHVVIAQGQTIEPKDVSLQFPVFIKPTNRGGGLGINSDSVAHTWAQVQTKVASIASEYGSDALLEEYLPGREFSVAILRDADTYSVMPLELIAPSDDQGARILSDQVKSANGEEVVAVTDPFLKDRVSSLALKAFHALGARDYGRIDIRLDVAGNPHFLEANLIPSLIAGYGSFPKACMLNLELAYEPMILHIVELASARTAAEPVAAPQPELASAIPA